jgi:hypothetical protein
MAREGDGLCALGVETRQAVLDAQDLVLGHT